MTRKIILAIETSIGGGSLSLLENRSELDFWIGTDKKLRADNLLKTISGFLLKNGLNPSDIKKIICSEGPGSQTGIRIGAATSKGLQAALNCELSMQTVLGALTLLIRKEGLVQTAIQISQNRMWRQIYEKRAGNPVSYQTSAELISKELFQTELKNFQETVLVTDVSDIFQAHDLGEDVNLTSNRKIVFVPANENLARLIGLFGADQDKSNSSLNC